MTTQRTILYVNLAMCMRKITKTNVLYDNCFV